MQHISEFLCPPVEHLSMPVSVLSEKSGFICLFDTRLMYEFISFNSEVVILYLVF